MKKTMKIIIPCIVMFLLIYLWRDGKDILNGLFVAFPIMYILLGLICSDKKELLICLITLSITFLIPINLWFHMGTCIVYAIIYSALGYTSYIIKKKLMK
ncbi:MAG: hypothetical protein J6A52_00850 [Bacilli bacterium]|nr:hypothetical protein [Bacilli bacterium]